MENLNISRVPGEPKLLPGSSAYASVSVQVQKDYEIETTPPLPAWPRGPNWQKRFNIQFSGGPFRAEHDGVNKIIVSCYPDDHPDWLKKVDAAIAKANEEEGAISYENGTV